MIIELLFGPALDGLNTLLGYMPQMPAVADFLSSGLEWIQRGLIFFPVPIWVFAIGSIMFWSFGGIGWAIIVWIYQKIPGVS